MTFTILCQARKNGVKQLVLLFELFKFLKDKEKYNDSTFQGHLKSGKNNFTDDEEVKIIDKSILVSHFKNIIIPSLNPDLYREIILAIRKVLSEDDIEESTVIGYENEGYTKQDIIYKTCFNLEETLSNVFYYCTVLVKNIPYKANIKEISNDFVSSFASDVNKILIEEEPKIITSKLKSSLNKTEFDKVFTKILTENLPYQNANEVSIYCLDILNSLIDYKAVKEFILHNIGNYIFSRAQRNNYNTRGLESNINFLAVRAYNRKVKNNPETNHFNEILLYAFLECILGAPKIYSKMELQNKSDDYNKYSSGIHVLSLRKGTTPFNQFVFGASDTIESLENAVDNSFNQIIKILSSTSDDYELLESSILEQQFDAETNEILYSMIMPQKGSKLSKPDEAFGIFLGYSISLSNKGLSNEEYRTAVKEKIELDVKSIKEYIFNKIKELGLENYSFYVYILPLNDAELDKESIMNEALGVE